MPRLEVFDPPMCCSTGVCGPDVDPKLVAFSSDLEWLQGQGVEVNRFNLSQEPHAFVANDAVKEALGNEGNDVLPLLLIDGTVVCRGFYPQRSQLQQMLNLDAVTDQDESTSSDGCSGSSCC